MYILLPLMEAVLFFSPPPACRPQTDPSITDINTLTGCMKGFWKNLGQPFPSLLYQISRLQVGN